MCLLLSLPPFLYQSHLSLSPYEKRPWKVAGPLHHYSCLSSLQRSFELIFSNWQHGVKQVLFFLSTSSYPSRVTTRWLVDRLEKISHWSFIWALNQKKKGHCTDLYQSLWPASNLYASQDKKVSFIVRWLERSGQSKVACIEKYIRTWQKP